MSVTIQSLADGRIVLSGKTFDIKDKIKELKGIWNPEEKTWTLPAGTDISWLRPPKPAAQPPVDLWGGVSAHYYRRPDRSGRCCASAVPQLDPVCPQGPMIYVCAAHGNRKSNYAGT
jgi:hypothetical protein